MHAVTTASIIQEHAILDDDALACLEPVEDLHALADLRAGLDDARLEYPRRALDVDAGIEAALHERVGRHQDGRVRATAKGRAAGHSRAQPSPAIVDRDADFDR